VAEQAASPLIGNRFFLSPLVPQCLLDVLDDRVIRSLRAVEVVDRGSQEMGLPRRTDQRRILEYRGQKLVFVGVIICFAAQPAMRRLHEHRHEVRAFRYRPVIAILV